MQVTKRTIDTFLLNYFVSLAINLGTPFVYEVRCTVRFRSHHTAKRTFSQFNPFESVYDISALLLNAAELLRDEVGPFRGDSEPCRKTKLLSLFLRTLHFEFIFSFDMDDAI